jgi:membrane associated rhomboid family serine protease
MYIYSKRSWTLIILILNIFFFFLFRTVLYPLIIFFSLNPLLLFKKFYFWQPLTYMFIHGDFSHLFFNMFIFFQVGLLLESLWGSKKFLLFYLLSGYITGLISTIIYYFIGLQDILLIGASGAIYALMVGFALTMPESIVNLYFIIPIKAKYTPILFAAIDIFFALLTPYESGQASSRISHLGHIVGILIGFILFPIIVNKNTNIKEIFNINFKKTSNNAFNNFKLNNFNEEKILINNSLYKIKNNIGFSQYEIEKLREIALKFKNKEALICDESIFNVENIDCLKCPKIALCILRYIELNNLN